MKQTGNDKGKIISVLLGIVAAVAAYFIARKVAEAWKNHNEPKGIRVRK